MANAAPGETSAPGKREAKYFSTKREAEEFAPQFAVERVEHGRAAITSEERQIIAVVRSRLGGDTSKLLEIPAHWEKTGKEVQPDIKGSVKID